MDESTSLRRVAPIPVAANTQLALFYVAINLTLLWIIPGWLLPHSRAWGWLLVPLVLLTNAFWSLVHEAIHDLLFPLRGLNSVAGRILAILFGAPFPILRLSHLLHHKLNRTPSEGTELFDATKTNRRAVAPGYYGQIFGGLYMVEVASVVLFWLPKAVLEWILRCKLTPGSVSALLFQSWLRRETLWGIRSDAILIMIIWSSSFWLYGEHSWMLLLALVGRGFLISFLDNIYHYATPVGDIFFACNLRLAPGLQKLLLNFNLHGIHHLNPALSWAHLPESFNVQQGTFSGSYFRAAKAQLHGPIALQDLPHAVKTSF